LAFDRALNDGATVRCDRYRAGRGDQAFLSGSDMSSKTVDWHDQIFEVLQNHEIKQV